MSARARSVVLGRIGAPFGLKGWVHVASYTEPPEALLQYREWGLSRAGASIGQRRLIEGRVQGERLVARLEGLEDRDAAASLTGASVEVEREALPATGEREYYRADLIGLMVRNTEGRLLGKVAYFIDAPAGAVMVVQESEGEGKGREHWVLADPSRLLEIDLTAGRILVEWPAELEQGSHED